MNRRKLLSFLALSPLAVPAVIAASAKPALPSASAVARNILARQRALNEAFARGMIGPPPWGDGVPTILDVWYARQCPGGEGGPEIVNLPHDLKVIPNNLGRKIQIDPKV